MVRVEARGCLRGGGMRHKHYYWHSVTLFTVQIALHISQCSHTKREGNVTSGECVAYTDTVFHLRHLPGINIRKGNLEVPARGCRRLADLTSTSDFSAESAKADDHRPNAIYTTHRAGRFRRCMLSVPFLSPSSSSALKFQDHTLLRTPT